MIDSRPNLRSTFYFLRSTLWGVPPGSLGIYRSFSLTVLPSSGENVIRRFVSAESGLLDWPHFRRRRPLGGCFAAWSAIF
jgi:hypothetical protein